MQVLTLTKTNKNLRRISLLEIFKFPRKDDIQFE